MELLDLMQVVNNAEVLSIILMHTRGDRISAMSLRMPILDLPADDVTILDMMQVINTMHTDVVLPLDMMQVINVTERPTRLLMLIGAVFVLLRMHDAELMQTNN